MNTVSPTAGPAYPPDPGKGHPAPTAPSPPPNIVHLVGVLRIIINCAHKLLYKLVQPGAVPDVDHTLYYGTTELPLIVRYILRGILRAETLELVLRERAKRGQDAEEWTPRSSPRSKPAGDDKKRDTDRTRQPPQPEEAVPFAIARPSRKALFAWARRRSPGAALKAICLDLAVLKAELGPAQWREIEQTINRFGGNAIKLFNEICDRWLPLSARASRKYKRRRGNAEPAPEPALPAAPPVLMPLSELMAPLLPYLRRSTPIA